MHDVDNSQSGKAKRGTPNKRQKIEFDNFFIPLLVDQDIKGLKCDKSFKSAMFAHAASPVNGKFGTNFTAKNVKNHCKILKAL